MPLSLWRFLLPLALLSGSCANPEEAEPLGSQTSAILNGSASSNSAVVALANPSELCSGFLLLPDLVLTARHCVSPLSGSGCTAVPQGTYAPQDLAVYPLAAVPSGGTPSLEVLAVWVPPNSDGQSLCGLDLALLRLKAPLSQAALLEPRLDGPPVLAEEFTAVGYGQTGGGNPDTAGQRREVKGSKVELVGAVVLPDGTVRRTAAEWGADRGPCYGDSGSPAIDLKGRAIGVMSRGPGATCVGMTYERVDSHAVWLKDRVRVAAKARGVPPPAWAAADPPDAGAEPDAGAPEPDAGAADAGSSVPAEARGCGGCGAGGAAVEGSLGLLFAAPFARRRRKPRK